MALAVVLSQVYRSVHFSLCNCFPRVPALPAAICTNFLLSSSTTKNLYFGGLWTINVLVRTAYPLLPAIGQPNLMLSELEFLNGFKQGDGAGCRLFFGVSAAFYPAL